MKLMTLGLCVLAFAATALGEDLVDNPMYKDWASFKPGSMVKMEMVSTTTRQGKDESRKVAITITLKEVTPEKVVLEQTQTEFVDGREMPPQTSQPVDIPVKVAKDKAATQPAGIEKKTEGDEDIEVAGKKYKAHWTEYIRKYQGVPITTKKWIVKEIPGGMARRENKVEEAQNHVGQQSKLTVVEFKVAE